MRNLLLCFLAAVLVSAGAAGEPLQITDHGKIVVGAGSVGFSAVNSGWSEFGNVKWRDVKKESGKDFQRFTGHFEFEGVPCTAVETVRRLAPNKFRIECDWQFDRDVKVNGIFSCISMPLPLEGILVDGKKLLIPELPKEMILRPYSPARTVTVRQTDGFQYILSGNLNAYIQDSRKWVNALTIRLAAGPGQGTMRKSHVAFDLELRPVEAVTVDIAPAARDCFDLNVLPAGTHRIGGVPFVVRDDRKAIVPESKSALRLPVAGKAGAVNLLHASRNTGPVVGYIDAGYNDGKVLSIPVKAKADCGDWTLGDSYPNAAIACEAEYLAKRVGLYASSFRLPRPNPVSLTFRAASPETAWIIAGVTLSNRPLVFPQGKEGPFTIKEGPDWKKLALRRRILPGSPLDFSAVVPQDAPAGQYGFVCSNDQGEFVFENAPEKKIRFYGANLCFTANFLDKAVADKLVEYLVRMGYNAIRFHHHDGRLVDPAVSDSVKLNPETLDKLDYLFAQCKKHGLYVTTDLYVNRNFKSPVSGCWGLKAQLPIDEHAMKSWQDFVRAWMTHRNPYTGLTWGEDPALISLCLVNEDTLSANWSANPKVAALYRSKFAEWKKGREGDDQTLFRDFLFEMQGNVLDRQIDFVKTELGLKTMIASLNWITDAPLTRLRAKLDLVDMHQYFSHPTFPEKAWQVPIGVDLGSSIRRGASLPREMMPTRIFGKPFTVTEFNFCNPNRFRAEGGPLMGAYAALQNWGGLWRFCWSHSDAGIIRNPGQNSFDASNDPMQQLSDRIILALFLRGDLAPSKTKISYPVAPFSQNNPAMSYPGDFANLGLDAQIGSHAAEQALPAGVVRWRPGMKTPESPRIKLDRKAGTLAVSTPLTEAATLPAGDLAVKKLRIKDASKFMTAAAISLDGKPLTESDSILVIHLGNISQAGARYDNSSLLRAWGNSPELLVERCTATLELECPGTPWRVAALALDGSETGEVPGSLKNGVFRFTADTTAFPGGVLAYHLSR